MDTLTNLPIPRSLGASLLVLDGNGNDNWHGSNPKRLK